MSVFRNSKRRLTCCVSVCKGERFDLAHKFPRDPERVALWLKALDCPKLSNIPVQKLGFVCSRHFRVQDYKHPLSRSINTTAIPSLNLKDLSSLHLSKDSALPHQQDASAPMIPEQEPFLQKEYIADIAENMLFQKEFIRESNVLEYSNHIPSQQFHDNIEVDNMEETDHEIKDECLSVHSIKDNENVDEETTNYATVFQVRHSSYQNPISLNSFWLRCHCKCPLCYDHTRHQRRVSPLDVREGIQPKTVKQVDGLDVLLVEWDDGHISEFDVDFLFSLENCTSDLSPRKTWDSQSLDISDFIPTEFVKVFNSDKDCKGIFRSLRELGVAVVSSVPTHSQSMAQLILCRLFPHLQTEAVAFREFNDGHCDISSNLTYWSVDSGLRCYFVKQETKFVLVDGLNVASSISRLHPEDFKNLSEVQVPLDIRDKHVKCEVLSPVIEMDAEKHEISKICIDVRKIGVFNTLPQEKVEDFYGSLKLMMRCIADKRNHWLMTLPSGSVVLLDNSRILHKCTQVPDIWEADIQRKDYISRMRYLGVI